MYKLEAPVLNRLIETNRKAFLTSGAALAASSLLPVSAVAAMPLPAQDQKADADMQRVITALMAFNAPPFFKQEPRVARDLPTFADAYAAVLAMDKKPGVEAVASIAHKVIAGPGGPLLLRIYTPAGSGPMPVTMYYHGGGFVFANLDVYDASPRALANASGAIVVAVAYRQAPEHPFPAAPLDAFAGYQWVLANAASFGGDPKRVAVTGESAGGNLATGVAIQARDKGIQLPVHQLLVYPVTTYSEKPPASYLENEMTLPLSTPGLAWFGKYYLSKPGDALKPLASVLGANLKGLPPATIINADLDPLRDDGAAYEMKLKAAGVSVNRRLYLGVTHEFFGMTGAVAKAKEAMDYGAAALKTSFGTK